MDLCEFKGTLGYTRLIQNRSRLKAHTLNPSIWESHTFSLSTREMKTGAIWLGRERNIKGKGQEGTH